MMIILSGLLVFLVLFLISTISGFLLGAPYAPSSYTAITRVLKKIRLGPNDVFYDLGSGDGWTLLEASNQGARSVGIEINPLLYIYSRWQIRRSHRQQSINVKLGNFWRERLESATVVFAFLLPEYMQRLERKLDREVKKGTYVLTYLARLPTKKALFIEQGIAVYRF